MAELSTEQAGTGKLGHGSYWIEWSGEAHCDLYSKWNAPEHPGYIYVLQTKPGTPIKVGTAKNVRARIATLQTGCPDELRLLLCFPGDRALERRIHIALRFSRVRGEWFDGPRIEAFLDGASEYADRAMRAFEESEPVPEPDFVPEVRRRGGLYPVGGDHKLQDRWRTKPDKVAPVVTRIEPVRS